jgi:hypothetical protein
VTDSGQYHDFGGAERRKRTSAGEKTKRFSKARSVEVGRYSGRSSENQGHEVVDEWASYQLLSMSGCSF